MGELVPIEVPDGCYQGLFTGHTMVWKVNDRDVYQNTDLGVRGVNVPHKFFVKDGRIVEKTIIPVSSDCVT